MRKLAIIFKFEWLYLIRQPMLMGALLLYFLLGCYGIYSGQSLIQNQLHAIDSIKTGSAQDLNRTLQAFTDTATAEKKHQARDAGDPNIVDYRMPRVAIDAPRALAGLSTGLRDITPLSEKISFYVNFSEGTQEVTNPMVLYDGNFDLTFVLIHLLPLVIIVFSYNILSAEKEQGTYTLLLTQGVGLSQLIAGKLSFRLLMIGLVTLVLNVVGLLSSPSAGKFLSDSILWLLAVLTYLLFWFSVVYLVITAVKTSVLSALSLAGIWMLCLILLPALVKIGTDLTYPNTLRADLDDKERHIGEEVWFSPPPSIVKAYFAAHPEYRQAYDPKDTTNDQNEGFFAGYYDLKEKRMSEFLANIKRETELKNAFTQKLIYGSPTQQMQRLLNSLAGTGRPDYLEYKKEVAAFQHRWAKCFYDRIFFYAPAIYEGNGQRKTKHFTPEEIKHLMVFERKFQPMAIRTTLLSLVPLWVMLLINIIIASLFINKIRTIH